PASVASGGTVQANVTINGPAPGGTVVTISGTSGITGSVTFPANQTTASGTFLAPAVLSNTTFTITAFLNGVTRTASLTVTAPTGPSRLTLAPNPAATGSVVTASVTLNNPAPSGGAVV